MNSLRVCLGAFLNRLVTTLAVAVVTLASVASAQSTGVVTGQVSNAATAGFLEGVVMAVPNTGKYVLTDREGRYEITLPAGVVSLQASYTGLEAKTVQL